MKTFKVILIFILSFFGFYFLLSLIGCMFFDDKGQHYTYEMIIGSQHWFFFYSVFLGWWIAGLIIADYIEND